MRRINVTTAVTPPVLVMLAAGTIMAAVVNGFAQDAKNECPKELFLIQGHEKVDTFSTPTAPLPGTKMVFSGKVCSDAEQDSRFHIKSVDIKSVDVWVPTWQLQLESNGQKVLQPWPSVPNPRAVPAAVPLAEGPTKSADGSSLAVSPSRPPETSTTAPGLNQSLKLEDLLRMGVEPPSAK